MIVNKNDFKKAFGKVFGVVPKKTTMPILQSVLIEVKNKVVYLTATDTENYRTASFTVEEGDDAKYAVNAEQLQKLALLRGNTFEMKHITNDGNSQVSIVSGKTKFDLVCNDASEFPIVPQENPSATITVTVDDLIDTIKKVKFAIDITSTKKFMTGVNFEIKEGKLTLIATNGKRMCLCRKQSDEFVSGDISCVITKECVEGLENLERTKEVKVGEEVKEELEKVVINLYPNKISFSQENFNSISTLISDTFPVKQVCSILFDNFVNETSAKVKAVDLIESIKIASSVSDEKNMIQFTLKENEIKTVCKTPSGIAEDTIPAETVGTENTFKFNKNYILDILNVCKEEDVLIESKGSSPFRISCGDYFSIIMPLTSLS